MPQIYQSSLVNPAYTGDRKLVVALPSAGLSLANSSFSLRDIDLHPR
jgi:hypothetical protein